MSEIVASILNLFFFLKWCLNRRSMPTTDLRQDRPISNGCCSFNAPLCPKGFNLVWMVSHRLNFEQSTFIAFVQNLLRSKTDTSCRVCGCVVLERLGMSKSPQTRRCTTGTIYTANIKMFEVRALAFESTSPNYVNQSWGKGFPIHFRFFTRLQLYFTCLRRSRTLLESWKLSIDECCIISNITKSNSQLEKKMKIPPQEY